MFWYIWVVTIFGEIDFSFLTVLSPAIAEAIEVNTSLRKLDFRKSDPSTFQRRSLPNLSKLVR